MRAAPVKYLRTTAQPGLCPHPAAGLNGSILRAGALWLLGVCGAELRAEHWGQAFGLVVAHVTHGDVVVSPWPVGLRAVAPLMMLSLQPLVAPHSIAGAAIDDATGVAPPLRWCSQHLTAARAAWLLPAGGTLYSVSVRA